MQMSCKHLKNLYTFNRKFTLFRNYLIKNYLRTWKYSIKMSLLWISWHQNVVNVSIHLLKKTYKSVFGLIFWAGPVSLPTLQLIWPTLAFLASFCAVSLPILQWTWHIIKVYERIYLIWCLGDLIAKFAWWLATI